jgi:nitrate/TMAO reductase-like tetraheme cytochrome c subunit
MKLRLPHSFYNTISYIGAAIASIAASMFVFLFVLASLSRTEKAYVGIVLFVVIPAFLIMGLIIIPVGMYLHARKIKRTGQTEGTDLPILNLNIPAHRNGTIIFAIGTSIFLFLSALGSYEAYHFTESTIFCGTLCHKLMIPEYTAFQSSPHARVGCAECHVGKGANWYVKSKLSGLYQVYATVANVYPRPIPTPIKDLRPARETCEQCHWPQKVYGKQQRREIYYMANEKNSRWEIDLLLNTGGGNPALGQSSGIHWHINPDIKVEYVTADPKRMQIPRVILTDSKKNQTTIYNSTSSPLPDSLAQQAERRVMDCIDCHNRPSHIYNDPSRFINIAIASGQIDERLPWIKKAALQACTEEYESQEQAMERMSTLMEHFYMENAPELYKNERERVHSAIAGVQAAFNQNIFPDMKVRWDQYPNHIGHQTSPGCFRCHDGQHVSESGRTISNACETCHQITAQGIPGQMAYSSSDKSLEFQHPVDIGEAWKEGNCSECHSTPPIAE